MDRTRALVVRHCFARDRTGLVSDDHLGDGCEPLRGAHHPGRGRAVGGFEGTVQMGPSPHVFRATVDDEEKVLRRELPGYAEYCEGTRYRLIPYIW